MNSTVEFAGVVKELATAVQTSGKTLEGWLSELSSRLSKIERKLEDVMARMVSLDKRLGDVLEHVDRRLDDIRMPTLEDLFEIEEEAEAPAEPEEPPVEEPGGDSQEEWEAVDEENLLATRLRERLSEKGVSLGQEECADVVRKLLMDVQEYVAAAMEDQGA